MKLTSEQKNAIKLCKDELFKEYSAYEYKKAINYLMKNRKQYKTNEDVKVALYDYLKRHHEHNKCWRNKLEI